MLQAKGELRAIVIAHLVEIPLNLFLSIILLGTIGLVGVPIAYFLAHLIVFFVSQVPFMPIKQGR